MDIYNRTVFNYRFFEHAYAYKKDKQGGKTLIVLIKLFKIKVFLWLLYIFESVFGFLLALPIPIYSDLVLAMITGLPGLPKMFGCYIRAVYYKFKLKKMEPNVIIEQGAVISYPKGVELHEFSLIDKYVIIAADSAVIGRRVHLAPYVIVTGGGKFIIEDYACMATGSRAVTSTESLKPGTRSSGPMVPCEQRDIIKGIVHIKKDAFVAVGVTILTDTVVEEGVVLAAHIVCPKKTEPWNYYLSQDSSGQPTKAKAYKKRQKLNLLDI